MAEEPIRIGILGAARIAPMAIIEPARERDDVRVVAVAARDSSRAQAFAAQHGLDGASQDYAALVERDDIDLVYVALPPDQHCHWTIAALEAGKAVLCEKPFALDAAEARSMVDAADRARVLLIEAFHYRFHAMMRQAVSIVRSGAIGAVVQARAQTEYPVPMRDGEPRWSAAHGGGAIMDLGCYAIHALRSLLGQEPEVLAATSRQVNRVDAETDAELLFGGTIPASVHARMDPERPLTEIVVEGRLGRLDIGGFVLPHRSGHMALTTAGETRELPVDGLSSYAAQLDHVVSVLRGREAPITGGEDAIANMRVVDRIRALSGASDAFL